MKLRDIWAAARGILFREKPEPILNLFGVRYKAMNAQKANLSPLENDRMLLFTAVAQLRGDVKNFADYIVQMGVFCDECIRHPDSPWAKDIDIDRIAHFKTSVDLLVASFSNVGRDYMNKVRSDMITPIDNRMLERARAFSHDAERIALLREIKELKAGKRSP